MGFDGWWHCTKCEAREPGLNKKFCTAYTHKRWNATINDNNDQDEDQDYPGQRIRNDAYIRMVEDHKDKLSET
eukprot:6482310-Heterocapsa_arctica.AAC.1